MIVGAIAPDGKVHFVTGYETHCAAIGISDPCGRLVRRRAAGDHAGSQHTDRGNTYDDLDVLILVADQLFEPALNDILERNPRGDHAGWLDATVIESR
ncbi:hypothetical protein [Williamsia sp. DF01-3]|uniref:hypothetical protein n=1 Tax=Williamsia sp. DF01-3 TaxID=2934157 RepID=UPI001FF579B5|nr:hypothetical protein [Williamsia sp. DF01-3]MCK0517419.1 hypothetical protein [Williamsia sp. DF01-3]